MVAVSGAATATTYFHCASEIALLKVCKHTEKEGSWLRSLDMVETDTAQIKLERQPHDGACGKECLTVALACEKVRPEDCHA